MVEITKDTGAHLTGIDSMRIRQPERKKGSMTVHGSAFECRVLVETCSLLYLNPPYDCEFGPHSNRVWNQYSLSTAIAG